MVIGFCRTVVFPPLLFSFPFVFLGDVWVLCLSFTIFFISWTFEQLD